MCVCVPTPRHKKAAPNDCLSGAAGAACQLPREARASIVQCFQISMQLAACLRPIGGVQKPACSLARRGKTQRELTDTCLLPTAAAAAANTCCCPHKSISLARPHRPILLDKFARGAPVRRHYSNLTNARAGLFDGHNNVEVNIEKSSWPQQHLVARLLDGTYRHCTEQ